MSTKPKQNKDNNPFLRETLDFWIDVNNLSDRQCGWDYDKMLEKSGAEWSQNNKRKTRLRFNYYN